MDEDDLPFLYTGKRGRSSSSIESSSSHPTWDHLQFIGWEGGSSIIPSFFHFHRSGYDSVGTVKIRGIFKT
jgi:hypothetical protein